MTTASDSKSPLSTNLGLETSSLTPNASASSAPSSQITSRPAAATPTSYTPSTTPSPLLSWATPTAANVAPTASFRPDASTLSTRSEQTPSITSLFPETTTTSEPDTATESIQSSNFTLIFDSGKCANLGVPKLEFTGPRPWSDELIPLGDHQYTVSLPSNTKEGMAYAFFVDNGEKCGYFAACILVTMFYDTKGARIQILRLGSEMYPFSLWVDGGRQPNGALADSQMNKYNCWGWSESECPFILAHDGDPPYAVTTPIPDATIHIVFCPADGPAASFIGSNTARATEIGGVDTGVIIATEVPVPISTFLVPSSTTFSKPRESTPPDPISALTFLPVPTILTDSAGAPTVTLTVSAAVSPAFSTIKDTQGSAISTISYNLTIPASPAPTPPAIPFTTRSWTTYMTINGSTVPAIGGQVEVLTTLSETYVLKPNTTIPLKFLSSMSTESVRSTQSSLPSAIPSLSPDGLSTRKNGTIAGAVVGSLLGITLLLVFIWAAFVKHRRQQKCTPDYADYRSPMWGSRSVLVPVPRGGSVLDLDSQPGPRVSLVEPWVEQQEVPKTCQKIQRNIGEGRGRMVNVALGHGAVTVASIERAHNRDRPPKSANRVTTQPQNRALTDSRAQHNTQLSNQFSREVVGVPLTAVVPMQSPPPMVPEVQTLTQSSSPPHNDDQAQEAAIPPRYNEAWNIRQPFSSG
ncbi:hypothetical protein RhiJN_07748 [Ceratobasidium sp. AG-Ba]|nr:hypothetical protein RhiJN_07748 [Ceratobasidium sp. AG-Ba]QRW08577.1 hypothetical protein RhiLY_07576 [Ceratobasidium sp. AG-Ba]